MSAPRRPARLLLPLHWRPREPFERESAHARAASVPRGDALSRVGWMVWPALTTDFKVMLGVMSAPHSGTSFEYEKEDVGIAPELSGGSVKG